MGKERDELLEEPMDELLDNMTMVKALVADVIECPLEALLEKVLEDGEFKIDGVVLERIRSVKSLTFVSILEEIRE